ncbi:hypothetical protein LSH36_48g05031 [Paralvinella palmiformis]|uniref:AMP-dependent synthetase/ligase domain-containing protein n=1 Tax=Paralvinella palmiformis TaxID=53620 RepID=A0AAD9K6I8_9ANNE|nr:hypothetical protein LSH36_48g05031 [Paralvinella palmiformis]
MVEFGNVLVCDDDWLERVLDEVNQCAEIPASPNVRLDNLVCVVYSSGTTGKPKGATLYIIPDSVIYDPRLLCHYIHRHQITRILFTPSLLEAVLDTRGLDVAVLLKSLRYADIDILWGSSNCRLAGEMPQNTRSCTVYQPLQYIGDPRYSMCRSH